MLTRLRTYAGRDGLGPLLVRATLGSAGIRIAGMAVTFLVGVQLARGLGVEGYGVYGLAMSIIAILNVPTQFGVPQLLTREVAVARAHDDWPGVRALLCWADRTVVMAGLLVAVLLALAVAAWPESGPPALMPTLAFGLILIPLVALANVKGAALRGLQRIVQGQMPEVLVRPAAYSVLLFVGFAVAPSPGAPTAMALHVAAAAVALSWAAVWLRRATPKAISPGRKRNTKRWLSSAFPMALTEGMRVLQGQLAILLLGLFSTAATVGLYRVSYAIVAMVATPVALLNVVVSPIIAKLHAEGERDKLQRMASAVALAMLAGVGVLTAPFLIDGSWITGLVFGGEYQPAVPTLLVLCLGQALNAAFGANAACLMMCGHERRVTRAFGLSLVVNFVGAVFLIPCWDEVGAAAASSLALLCWNLLLWRDVRTRIQVESSVLGLFRS